MQNEANSHLTKCTKHKRNKKKVSLFTTIFSKKTQTFPKISKKSKRNAFCKFSTLTHLNPDITKTYKILCQQIRFTFHASLDTKKSKTNSIIIKFGRSPIQQNNQYRRSAFGGINGKTNPISANRATRDEPRATKMPLHLPRLI